VSNRRFRVILTIVWPGLKTCNFNI